MEAKLDCGDNSCEFAENKTGMRTNGGCRCLKDLDFSRRMAVRRYLVALREENARLREREVDVARVHDLLGEDRADLPRLVRERWERLTRELDEARALLAPMSCHHIKWCDDDGRCTVCTLHACIAEAEAEVARLEGLILRVDDMLYERKQPIIILSQEARRIRAQREGGLYHSHTCDLHPDEQCQACEEGR